MKKNILLITTDQQRWDAIGFNNKIVKTPNLDKLAEKGIVFEKAYTCNPVCTPARCSILTGHYPSKHGCYTIGTSLSEGYPTIPEIMSENGYFTGLLGKAHFQSCCTQGSFEAEPDVHNLDFFKKWNGPYYGFEHAKLSIGHATESYSGGMNYGVWLKEKGYEPSDFFGNNEYTDFGNWEIPEEVHPSTWVAEETIDAIDLAQSREKPFYLWASFQDPHNPCCVPEKWADLYDINDMPLYGMKEGEHDNKPPFYLGATDKEINFGRGYGDVNIGGDKNWHCVAGLDCMEPEEKRRDIMLYYYGMMSLLDDKVGRIISHLEKNNLMDNTIIVFTTDHGDYMGNHGMWWKGLPAYEDAQKIPFMVYSPDCKTPGKRSRSFQSLVDLGKTFLSVGNCDIPVGIQGVNQQKVWENINENPARDHALIEFRPTECDFMQTTYLYKDYKLVVYTKTEWGELYDLEKDPDQFENLWDNPDYKKIKNDLILKYISAEMNKEGVLKERTMWA